MIAAIALVALVVWLVIGAAMAYSWHVEAVGQARHDGWVDGFESAVRVQSQTERRWGPRRFTAAELQARD